MVNESVHVTGFNTNDCNNCQNFYDNDLVNSQSNEQTHVRERLPP